MRLATTIIYIFLLLCTLCSLSLSAHQFSTAHLQITQQSANQHNGDLSLSLQDLEQVIGIDLNRDSQLTWKEVNQALPLIHDYLTANIQFKQQQTCRMNWQTSVKLTEKFGNTLLLLPFQLSCDTNESITVNYQAFIQNLNQHKLLITWQIEEQQYQGIIDQDNSHFETSKTYHGPWDTVLFYFWQGIIHILAGFDHLVFVLALVLPIAWLKHTTQQSKNFKLALKSLFWLISGFTIAHSITLILTAFNIINFSSKWVEAGIALSVVFTAINIMTHWIKNIFWITLLFGFLHGMGFAGALGELGLSQEYQLISILVFNIGVEFGQLIFIAALLPFIWLIRQREKLQQKLVPITASTIALAGTFWLVERVV